MARPIKHEQAFRHQVIGSDRVMQVKDTTDFTFKQSVRMRGQLPHSCYRHSLNIVYVCPLERQSDTGIDAVQIPVLRNFNNKGAQPNGRALLRFLYFYSS